MKLFFNNKLFFIILTQSIFLLQDIEENEQKHCQFKMPPCRDHDHDDDFADNNDDHVLCLFF